MNKLEQIRQLTFVRISSCPAFSKCAPYIGIPYSSVCDATHQIHDVCMTCRWNVCQICCSTANIPCVQCRSEPCYCRMLPFPDFFGWSGVCEDCLAPGDIINSPPFEPIPSTSEHDDREVCEMCGWNCCKFCGSIRMEQFRVGGYDWECSCRDVVIDLTV